VIVLVAALGGLGWYLVGSATTAAATAAVGDCVAQAGEDNVRIIGCVEPDAKFRVVGRLEDRRMIDAGLFACSDFPEATSSFWQGLAGPSEPGLVLCLAPVTPVAP